MYNFNDNDLGRAILFLVCPSVYKECGIGRYTLQVAEAMRPLVAKVEIFTNTSDVINACNRVSEDVIIVFQHEYSLLDFNSFLAEHETTSDVISNFNAITALSDRFKVCVVMHTMVPNNPHTEAVNKQFLSARMPIFSTSREGARHFEVNFLELGCPREHVISINKTSREVQDIEISLKDSSTVYNIRRHMRVASFGFLSPNKDVDSVLELCAETGAHVRANFASDDDIMVQKVLDKAQALNVRGKITFDFLSESALIEMLQRCDIVYLPQKDNKHFSTSATARLGLALGKVVIVPPVRPFHDLASGVVFADLDTAIDFVNTLSIDSSIFARSINSSASFSLHHQMSEVYSDLCKKLLKYKVWCGGKNNSAALNTMHNEIALVDLQGDVGSATSQNINGFKAIGRAIHQGMIVLSNLTMESEAIQKDDIKPFGLGVSWEEIARTENSFFQARCDRSEEAWVKSYTRFSATSSRQMAALIGTNADYLSVIDFLDAPSFCQVLYLHLELGISVNQICSVLLKKDEYNIDSLSNEDTMSGFSSRLTALKALVLTVPASKSRLIWHAPLSSWVAGRKMIVLPSSLLSYPVSRFIQSAYLYLLGRPADQEGLLYFRDSMRRGATKTDIAWALGTSPELKKSNVILAYTPETWRNREKDVERRAALCSLIAPSEEIGRNQNLLELDKVYAFGMAGDKSNLRHYSKS